MELKLQTEIGEMTAIFVQDILSTDYTAWFKEKPNVIAQGENISEAIESLHKILNMILVVENE